MKSRFVLVACLAAFAALGGPAFAAASQGEITYMEGQVTIDRVPASIGDLVPLGATVRTEKLSQCEIVFRQRNIHPSRRGDHARVQSRQPPGRQQPAERRPFPCSQEPGTGRVG